MCQGFEGTRCAQRLLLSMCNLSRLCDQLHIGLLTKMFIILASNSDEKESLSSKLQSQSSRESKLPRVILR